MAGRLIGARNGRKSGTKSNIAQKNVVKIVIPANSIPTTQVFNLTIQILTLLEKVDIPNGVSRLIPLL